MMFCLNCKKQLWRITTVILKYDGYEYETCSTDCAHKLEKHMIKQDYSSLAE